MRRLRIPLALASSALLLLSACGGSSPAGGTGSHDTPEGAVRGFIDAVAANDISEALMWIPPGPQRKAAEGLLRGSQGVRVTFAVQHVDVGAATTDRDHPDQAQVPIHGQATACVNGGSSDVALNTCFPFSQFSQVSGADRVSCIRIAGLWYVDFSEGGDSPPPSTSGGAVPASPEAPAPTAPPR